MLMRKPVPHLVGSYSLITTVYHKKIYKDGFKIFYIS